MIRPACHTPIQTTGQDHTSTANESWAGTDGAPESYQHAKAKEHSLSILKFEKTTPSLADDCWIRRTFKGATSGLGNKLYLQCKNRTSHTAQAGRLGGHLRLDKTYQRPEITTSSRSLTPLASRSNKARQARRGTAMVSPPRPFDIIVYGATGFTGEAVARALAQDPAAAGRRWALGGRNRARLDAVRARLPAPRPPGAAATVTIATDEKEKEKEKEDGDQAKQPGTRHHARQAVAVVVVDAVVDDRAKLAAAFGTARVLVNCAGPFASCGRNVVQACIDANTDYVDIAGETQFIFSTMLEEHERARQRGVLVVSACGFDSIPADIGCKYVTAELDRVLRTHADAHGASSTKLPPHEQSPTPATAPVVVTHIESFLHVSTGAVGHATTLECALLGLATVSETNAIRRQLLSQLSADPKSHPDHKTPRLKLHRGIFRDMRAATVQQGSGYPGHAPFCTLFTGTDSAIVKQTERLDALECLREPLPAPSISYAAYIVVGYWPAVLRLLFYGALCMALCKYPAGRRLIMRYPSLFTHGLFSHQGPSEEQRANTSASFDFFGKRFVDGVERARVVTQVAIPRDPGYTGTARIVLAAAYTLLDDRAATPEGGVLTPAAAFAKTKLMQRLSANNTMEFTTILAESTPLENDGS
jgi:short subunit dehydrogenase-like uncharacterized protein